MGQPYSNALVVAYLKKSAGTSLDAAARRLRDAADNLEHWASVIRDDGDQNHAILHAMSVVRNASNNALSDIESAMARVVEMLQTERQPQ